MRIVLVAHVNPFRDSPAGIPAQVKGLWGELQRREIETVLVGWTDQPSTLPGFLPVVRGNAVGDPRFFLNLFKLAPRSFGPESIIHVHRPDQVLPFLFRKNRIVCTLHGAHIRNMELKKSKAETRVYAAIQRMALQRVQLAISVSEENRKYFCSKYPFMEAKTEVVPVGVSSVFKPMAGMRGKYGFADDERVLIYVGRLEKEKQVEVILNAVRGTRYKLVIVGGGREEERLRRDCPPNVLFMGVVAQKIVAELINCADALVLTSKHEGMPSVVLESLACGVPVLSTDVGDVRDVVLAEKTGFIVTEEDLREKIERVGDLRLRDDCLAVASRYSWERIGSRTVDLYRRLA